MNEIKLPQLDSYVYVITWCNSEPFCITKDRVYMKNKTDFITEDMLSGSVIEEYRQPMSVEDYGYYWTKTLKEAKELVIKYFKEQQGREVIITKLNNNDWDIERGCKIRSE